MTCWRALPVALALSGAAWAQPTAAPCACTEGLGAERALAVRIVDGRPTDGPHVVAVRLPVGAPVRVGRFEVIVSPAVMLHGSDTTRGRILGPAVWLGKRATVVGIVCGVAYAVGGLVVDAATTGLNEGTALAFGAIVGMPVLFGTAGFAAGAAGGAVDVAARALFGDDG